MAQMQTVSMTLTPVKKGEEPKEVMDAIKKDFPKAIVGDLSFLPAKLYGEEWSVAFRDNLDGNAVFYHVTLKEGKELYRAVYDKKGKLVSSKFVIPEAQLPAKVSMAINEKYPQWAVVDNVERIVYKNNELSEVFHIRIQQDDEFRTLFITNAGKILKDKSIAHST